jgi:KaiC/GvpD/RAD55 family RecA-like ATPase
MPTQEYFKSVINILKKDVKTKNIIYITTNKPYKYLMNLLNEEKINTESILVIDCISNQLSESGDASKRCVFLESPQNISGLSIAISQAIKSLAGEATVIFDSLSTLLIYNNEEVIGKFSNFIINKMQQTNISSVFFVIESDMDKKVMGVISSFVDEVRKWQT